MREKPIIFSTEMVRAILYGRKTMTRRVVKPQPELTYGITDDIIYIYHKKGVCIYELNNSGEWRCFNADTGIPQRGLYGRVGRGNILPDKILRLWKKGIRGLVSASWAQDEQGLPVNINESQQREGNQERSQIDMLGISRGTNAQDIASTTLGRESGEQQTGKSDMGNSGRELARQEGSRYCECRGEALGCQILGQGTGTYQMGNRERVMQSEACSQNIRGIPSLNIRYCPFSVGAKLWVRETFAKNDTGILYKADGVTLGGINGGWKPSIFMPKAAARIWLEVTDVRVERLQDITPNDIAAEGLPSYIIPPGHKHYNNVCGEKWLGYEWFRDLWDSFNSKRGYGWETNPWVWVIEFRRIAP